MFEPVSVRKMSPDKGQRSLAARGVGWAGGVAAAVFVVIRRSRECASHIVSWRSSLVALRSINHCRRLQAKAATKSQTLTTQLGYIQSSLTGNPRTVPTSGKQPVIIETARFMIELQN